MPGAPSVEELLAGGRSADPRWSPGGRRLGWIAADHGGVRLVVTDRRSPTGPPVPWVGAAPSPVRPDAGGGWCWLGAEAVAVVTADGLRAGGPGATLPVLAAGRTAAPTPIGSTHVALVVETDDACFVAEVPRGTGRLRRVSDADFAWDPCASPDGRRLAWHEWDLPAMPWDASRIVVADRATGELRTVAGTSGVAVGQPRWSPDGRRLAFVSDASGWLNVWTCAPDGTDAAPVAAEACEHALPSWGTGQRSYAWSPDGSAIAWCRNEDGDGRLVVGAADGTTRPRTLGRGWHLGLDWGPSGLAATRFGARTPPAIVVVDPVSGACDEVSGSVPSWHDALVEPQRVSWPGEAGDVPGLLYRPPRRAAPSRPPLLVDVHGGPTGQATARWDPLVQCLVTRGWAVLAPDPRGSTGHGRAHARALAGAWGDADVRDTVAGIDHAIASGWCDPERVAIAGASAGGLAALLVGMRPDRPVCAVAAWYPVTDLLHLAATTHRFESRYTDWLVGPLPDLEATYRDRSPLTRASELRVPTLVLHGGADRAVPVEQARRLAAAAPAVELHVYEGEGHGWSDPAVSADALARTVGFLERVVDGP